MKKAVVLGVLTVIVLILTGCGGTDETRKRQNLTDIEVIHELREKLWAATDNNQRNQVIDSFQNLQGPDVKAAEVLLAYLRERERTDAWNITGPLIELMTDEQVARLAREFTAYGEANGTRYLVSVLAARADTAPVLTDAMLSLQEAVRRDWYSSPYHRFVELAWQEVFSEPTAAVNWLDNTYTRLTDPVAKENLFYSVSSLVWGGLSGTDRVAAVGWLWQVYKQEKDPATRSRQLIELYKLGETGALAELQGIFTNLSSAPERTGVIRGLGDAVRWHQQQGEAREAVIRWLWEVAGTDNSVFVRQVCLSTLNELDERRAMAELVREIDENGLATLEDESGFQSSGLSWQFLEQVSREYPQSYLARGIRAYEQVRGEPYFASVRMEQEPEVWLPYEYGDEQYDPEREIPGWEKFLADFPHHPASDDAAYRLARCYEIEGRWADALNTLQKALLLPDGDIRYHVAGRLVYILDVRMMARQLQELSPSMLDPALYPLVDYTLAVKEMRREDFTRAATLMEQFISKYKETGGSDPGMRLPYAHLAYFGALEYDFWNAVEQQLLEAKSLAELNDKWKHARQPALLYDLAAAIYHNQLLYYNHLWLGGRQEYNWYGYINQIAYGRAPTEMAAFGYELINYGHSLDYFQQVYRDPYSPLELKAKALYSVGLCYIGISQWGEDAWFSYSPSGIRRQIIVTYEKFVEEYPDSSMVDDALLVLGAYTGDASYLERIITEYPDKDMVEKAKHLMEEIKLPYYGLRLGEASVPFKILLTGDVPDRYINTVGESVPAEVREWVAANSQRSLTGTMTSGAWTS